MQKLATAIGLLAVLSQWLPAQPFTAALEVFLSGVASQPSGPLNTSVSLLRTVNAGGVTLSANLDCVPPTAANPACSITTQFDTGFLSASLVPAYFRADTTLWISGPSGRWGSIEVELLASDGPWPTVDVGDDGTNEAAPGQFYGALSSAYQTRIWSIPVQLTSAPLPVRIVFPTTWRISTFLQRLDVRFVPWSASAADLGTGCPENHTGWVLGSNADFPYALSVRPGSGGAAAQLHARGHGPLQAFVVASQPARLPIGTIPFGIGCDDLLTSVITTAAGVQVSPFQDHEWTLDVPPLPPGLTFYLQHVSLSPVFGFHAPQGYFGVSNAVRYQT